MFKYIFLLLVFFTFLAPQAQAADLLPLDPYNSYTVNERSDWFRQEITKINSIAAEIRKLRKEKPEGYFDKANGLARYQKNLIRTYKGRIPLVMHDAMVEHFLHNSYFRLKNY